MPKTRPRPLPPPSEPVGAGRALEEEAAQPALRGRHQPRHLRDADSGRRLARYLHHRGSTSKSSSSTWSAASRLHLVRPRRCTWQKTADRGRACLRRRGTSAVACTPRAGHHRLVRSRRSSLPQLDDDVEAARLLRRLQDGDTRVLARARSPAAVPQRRRPADLDVPLRTSLQRGALIANRYRDQRARSTPPLLVGAIGVRDARAQGGDPDAARRGRTRRVRRRARPMVACAAASELVGAYARASAPHVEPGRDGQVELCCRLQAMRRQAAAAARRRASSGGNGGGGGGTRRLEADVLLIACSSVSATTRSATSSAVDSRPARRAGGDDRRRRRDHAAAAPTSRRRDGRDGQSDAPFSPLKRFGTQFLNRFEAAQRRRDPQALRARRLAGRALGRQAEERRLRLRRGGAVVGAARRPHPPPLRRAHAACPRRSRRSALVPEAR